MERARGWRRIGTGTGFRRRIIKFSARPVKNLVNLCAKILSILSACFILMLMRIELMDGSISTCSFSLRAMCIGLSTISEDVLPSQRGTKSDPEDVRGRCRIEDGGIVLCFDLGDVVPLHDLGGEVFKAERGRERGADAAQVWP